MILVTGSKRSGTSLWMQVLIKAGLPHLGSAFPRDWEERISEANPQGFYESKLRGGINYKTNPHPETGAYLHPEQTRKLVVKVFVPGLVRTDHAFLHRVVATIRPWREYVASLRRLRELEREAWNWSELKEPPKFLAPEAEWFAEQFQLLRDLVVRQYSYHLVSHGNLLADPEDTIGRVLTYLDHPADVGEVASLVDRSLYRERAPEVSSELLTDRDIEVMDALYERVHRRAKLDRALLVGMNEAFNRLQAAGALERRPA
jgi:hypothetical protein